MARRRWSVALWLVIALASMAIGFGSASPSVGPTTRDPDQVELAPVTSVRPVTAVRRVASDVANQPLLHVFALVSAACAVALAVTHQSRRRLAVAGRRPAGCVPHGVRAPPALRVV